MQILPLVKNLEEKKQLSSTCPILGPLLNILFFFEVRAYSEREFLLCILPPVVMQSKQHCSHVIKQIALSQGLGFTGLPYAGVHLQISGIQCVTVGRSLFTERISARKEICLMVSKEDSQGPKTACLPSVFWSFSRAGSLEAHALPQPPQLLSPIFVQCNTLAT